MDEPVKKRTRRTFTEEFKRNAVSLIVVQGYSYGAAAESLGVSSGLLHTWVRKYGPDPQEPVEGEQTVAELQAENRRLRKQLQDAELEREILKKATAYFAKESQ